MGRQPSGSFDTKQIALFSSEKGIEAHIASKIRVDMKQQASAKRRARGARFGCNQNSSENFVRSVVASGVWLL